MSFKETAYALSGIFAAAAVGQLCMSDDYVIKVAAFSVLAGLGTIFAMKSGAQNNTDLGEWILTTPQDLVKNKSKPAKDIALAIKDKIQQRQTEMRGAENEELDCAPYDKRFAPSEN